MRSRCAALRAQQCRTIKMARHALHGRTHAYSSMLMAPQILQPLQDCTLPLPAGRLRVVLPYTTWTSLFGKRYNQVKFAVLQLTGNCDCMWPFAPY